jgi:hypothetical protein
VLTRDGLRISPQSPTPGSTRGLRARADGANDGDVREIPMTFPADFEKAELRGKQGVTRVTSSRPTACAAGDEELLKLLRRRERASAAQARAREARRGEDRAGDGRVEN